MASLHGPGNGSPIDPVAVIRSYLALAIQIGAPVYNSGDPRGCYEVYACTARMLLRVVSGGEEAKQTLREGLQRAALEPDVNEQAWIMRRAFDAVLGEAGGDDEDEVDAPPDDGD